MLFKILHGDESNISLDVTPFHAGWAYVTHSGNFYVDLNIGTLESPNNQRIKISGQNAETLCGLSLDELKTQIANQDAVILDESQTYTDKAIEDIKANIATQDTVVLAEAQSYTDAALETATTQDTVVLHEAQAYTDIVLATATTQDAVVLHEAQTYTDSQINDVVIARLEALEKIINNSPLVDDFEGVGALDAGTILDFVPSDITIIDPGTIIKV